MNFSNKLTLLTKSLGITNSRLAKALSIDTSLVSRWKSGTRSPSKNSSYLKNIASYICTYAKLDYQKMALLEIMDLRFEKKYENSDLLADSLLSWLSDVAPVNKTIMDSFIEDFSLFGSAQKIMPQYTFEHEMPQGTSVNCEVFFGIKGKRQGVIKLLTIVAELDKPCTILLYSDENMDWLSGDRQFYVHWGMLLSKIISNGSKIKIIHTVNRDLGEMLSAIERWLPLYMTGAIEPYYYPRYHEGIFRRALFIVPDIVALTSECLSEQSESTDNILHTDLRMLSSLKDKFYSYLKICRPLMQITTGRNPNEVIDLIREFHEQSGDTIYRSSSPSFVTMTKKLSAELLDKVNIDRTIKDKLLNLQKTRIELFLKNIGTDTYTELVSLPQIDDVFAGRVPVPFSSLFGNETIFYTKSVYKKHLESIVELLSRYENYNLFICPYNGQNINLSAKLEVGAIIANSNVPVAVFAFNQPNMTDAFYSYLENEQIKIPNKERSKKYVLQRLREIIEKIT